LLVGLMFILVLGLASCGTKTGVVSYTNVNSVVVEDAATSTTGSTYDEVIVLLGAPTDASGYASGNGVLNWTDGEYNVDVTFTDNVVTAKTSTGLYESIYKTPIGEKTGVWEWIILQLGYFTYYASNLFGLLGNTYYYWIGLLIMTLAIRTLAWPVYAKTNDMSLKMSIAQPELDKLNEKYEGRTDQASQQRKQMEMMDIYKKYKINFAGCLMPFLQMPIFIAMYQVVQRFPLTDITLFGGVAGTMNTNFLWTNLGNTDWLANLPLAIVVAGTMFLSQWLTMHRQKAQSHSKYKNQKAQQSQKQMQMFMYVMVIMMAGIALQNAGIAFYWIIGNSYQLLQSYLSHRSSGQRKERLQNSL